MSEIPKIFHQIWLGGELPKKFKKYQDTWIKFHPDWEVKMWTERNIYQLENFNEKDYNKLSNFAEKSDYLRFVIILEYGGVYVDTDFECLRSIEKLIQRYDFFIGYDGFVDIDSGDSKCIPNGIFGAIPSYKLIKSIFATFSKQIEDGKNLNSLMKIGPGYIRPFIENYKGNIKIFEPKYFYPEYIYPKNWFSNVYQIHQKKAYALHHYSFSWLPRYKRIEYYLKGHKYTHNYYILLQKIYRFLKRRIKALCP